MNIRRILLAVVLISAVLTVALLLWQRAQSGGLVPRIGTPANGRYTLSDEEWRARLKAESFRITRRKGTERAGTGEYADTKSDGIYHCVCCGQPLFDSAAKFNSGTGWPSFYQPVDENNVSLVEDNSLLARRTEVICSRCDAHLGHVFEDGPQPTGLRYCLNSAALVLKSRAESKTPPPGATTSETLP